MTLAALLLAASAVRGVDGAEALPPHIIAVAGSELPHLAGAPIECLRAAARDADGSVRPVPVQIDERVRDGNGFAWAFEGGEEPLRDPDTAFDADDLLLLDVRDAGACADVPAGGSAIVVEDGGCITLACDATPPVPPSRVRLLNAGQAIAGNAYQLGFAPDGKAWLNALRLGDGANLLDRSKGRLRLELPLGLVVDRDEDDLRTRVTGEHVGPLRIVREIEARGRVALNLYSRPTRDRFIFYADGFSIPTSVVISPSAALVLRAVVLRLSMDLRPSGAALQFRSAPEIPATLPITGHEGRRGSWAPLQWYLLQSGSTGLLGWLETDPAYASDVTLYYNDDVAHADPPENVPGEFGDHGFLFVRSEGLATGTFRVVTQAWVVRGHDLEDPAGVRERFTRRPTYVVR